MTRAVLKEKIPLKSSHWTLSKDNVYWLHQKLLEGAIPLSSLLSLCGHCLAIGRISDLNVFIDTDFMIFYRMVCF